MMLDPEGTIDLTYCTNIHPAEGWKAVEANIRRFAPALKAKLAPSALFGVGMRLSALEARELLEGGALQEFASFLNENGLYVALINGFPYGPFHGAPVKARVYAPDWRDEARVRYTFDLVKILRQLLPANVEGGISTVPISYKGWMRRPSDADHLAITRNLVRVAERLVRLRREEGKFIHLDIEPEPGCVLENSRDVMMFFQEWLLPEATPLLAAALGIDANESHKRLLEHIQICFDCCHFAVEFEDPIEVLRRIRSAGIRIGRVQLSSAVKAFFPGGLAGNERIAAKLESFAEGTYLHQVGEWEEGPVRMFSDLQDALMEKGNARKEWRIHFHVPLFTAEYEGLFGTQDYTEPVLSAAFDELLTRHLEIETYTWDVLPQGLKLDLLESINREYGWVLGQLSRRKLAVS